MFISLKKPRFFPKFKWIVLAGAFALAAGVQSAPAGKTAAPVSEDALPPEALASIREAIERDQYKAEAAAGEEGIVQASNPAHGYVTRFSGQGIEVTSAKARMSLRLTGYGYEGRMQRPAAGKLEARGQRVENVRGGLTEWYVNRPAGLEQGFILAERPEGAEAGGPLRIELEVSGADVTASEDGAAALLGAAGAGRRLRYAGLKSWDAEGKDLVSHLTVSEQRIVLRVEDERAVYPVTIDPTLTEDAKLIASDAAAGDVFGFSVSASGDTVVAGADLDDCAAGLNCGAAYVFEKPAGGWTGTLTEGAKLIASDAAPNDRLGRSVSISGDTVVAGALNDACAAGGACGAAYVFEKPAGGLGGDVDRGRQADRQRRRGRRPIRHLGFDLRGHVRGGRQSG